MRTLDDTSIYMTALGDLVVRVSDQKGFFAIIAVPDSMDLNIGLEGVRIAERELVYRLADITIARGDVLAHGDETWRVRDIPKPTEDGSFYTVGLIK